jgi:hypothetical protein
MPELLPPEPLGFRDRLAMGLSQMPQYQPRPYESGGTRFGRGLISGLAGGFSRAGVADIQRKDETRKLENATRSTTADLANRTSMETWRQRVTAHFKLKADKAGNVTLTKEAAEAAGLPASAAGRPMDYAKWLDKAAQHTKDQEARGLRVRELGLSGDRNAETRRHNMAMEGRASSGGSKSESGDPSDIRWTKAGAAQIAAAQRQVEAALAWTFGDATDPEVAEAKRILDGAQKRDIAGQVRSAKTLSELSKLAEKIEAFYPQIVSDPDLMIPTVMRDKALEFGAR